MSEPIHRDLSPAERARLTAELERARANPVSVGQALTAAASVLGAFVWKALVAFAALAAGAYVLLPAWVAGFLARAAGGAALLAAGGTALLVITANRSWMSFLARLTAAVDRDLTDGRVAVRTYRPSAAATLKLDDADAIGHLLELEGSLLIFVPAPLSAGAASFTSTRIELAQAPASQVFVGAYGTGDPLPAPTRTCAAAAVATALARPCVPVPGTLEKVAPPPAATAGPPR